MDSNQDSMLKDKPASSKYAKRRTVSSGETINVPILDVGMLDNTTLGILVYVADDKYILKFDRDSDFNNDKLYNVLLDNIESGRLDEDSLREKELTVAFNDNMDKFGFEEGEYKYECEYTKNDSNMFEKDDISENINHILYNREFSEDEGWNNRISHIEEVSSEKIKITVSTELGSTISWVVKIPKTTEQNVSEVAKLIENEGGGLPNQLSEEGYVTVIHKDDINNNLDYVKINENGWVLVVDETYKDWIKQKKKKSKRSNKNKKSRKSSGNIRTKQDAKSKIFRYTFQHMLIIGTLTLLRPIMMPNQSELSSTGQEVISSIDSLINMMITISTVMLICFVIYQIFRYVSN